MSPRSIKSCRTISRRSSIFFLSRPLLAADQALRQQDCDLQIAVERHVATGADDVIDRVGVVDAIGEKASEPQHVLGDGAHRHLPRIELAELATHGDQDDAAEAAIAQKRKHIDAIADAARLHQERRALAAERGAGDQADAFLLGGSTTSAMVLSAWHSSISRLWPASGT